jgi:hypothetical protein
VLERFEQDKAATEFQSFRPTVFFGVPRFYVRLLGMPAATALDIGPRDAAVRVRIGAAAFARARRVSVSALATPFSSGTA